MRPVQLESQSECASIFFFSLPCFRMQINTNSICATNSMFPIFRLLNFRTYNTSKQLGFFSNYFSLSFKSGSLPSANIDYKHFSSEHYDLKSKVFVMKTRKAQRAGLDSVALKTKRKVCCLSYLHSASGGYEKKAVQMSEKKNGVTDGKIREQSRRSPMILYIWACKSNQ